MHETRDKRLRSMFVGKTTAFVEIWKPKPETGKAMYWGEIQFWWISILQLFRVCVTHLRASRHCILFDSKRVGICNNLSLERRSPALFRYSHPRGIGIWSYTACRSARGQIGQFLAGNQTPGTDLNNIGILPETTWVQIYGYETSRFKIASCEKRTYSELLQK